MLAEGRHIFAGQLIVGDPLSLVMVNIHHLERLKRLQGQLYPLASAKKQQQQPWHEPYRRKECVCVKKQQLEFGLTSVILAAEAWLARAPRKPWGSELKIQQ